MKLFFTFSSLIIINLISAQNITFADPDFKTNILYVNGLPGSATALDLNGASTKIDANNDGEIQISEAQNISSLKLNNQSRFPKFSSMSEISFFSNLKILEVTFNNINNVDVSNLLLLEQLTLNNNSNLSSLNIQNLLNITNLSVQNGQLSTIDVTNFTNLTSLLLRNNQLTNLVLTNNINLTNVDCDNNQLTTLTIGSKPNLALLSCKNNLLTTIDISNTGCYGFFCDNNNLVSLNIRNNISTINVSNFSAANNPNLAEICCDINEVSWLQNIYLPSIGLNNVSVSNCTQLATENFKSKNEILLYPIPSNDRITINSNQKIVRLELINVANHKIMEDITNSYSIDLNVQNYPRGIYFLKISTENKNTVVRKVILN